MPDPRTVEAVLLRLRMRYSEKSLRYYDAFFSYVELHSIALADLSEKLWRRRNTWKRPPWQIGRRQSFFFDAKKARREARLEHEKELYREWQSDITAGMRGQ